MEKKFVSSSEKYIIEMYLDYNFFESKDITDLKDESNLIRDKIFKKSSEHRFLNIFSSIWR